MATNSKLSESLRGNRNAAKDYARKLAGDAGAKLGGLEEKASFSATGAKVGFRFGSALEKYGPQKTTTVTSTTSFGNQQLLSSSQTTERVFEGASTKMAKAGAKIGAKVADISPLGEISGRRKALKAFDSGAESIQSVEDAIKKRMWGG